MPTVSDIHNYLNAIAPVEMKMDFDNVGHLVGYTEANADKILVALDITNDVITEAIETGAKLIVSHHPLFFTLKSVTDADITGKKIVRLLSAGISAICMHTNLDAARGGTNDALAQAAGLIDDGRETTILTEEGRLENGEAYSYGRIGCLKAPCPLDEYLEILKRALKTEGLRYHNAGREVYKVAVVGGSGGSDLHHAVSNGCDTFVTADVKYDVFLEAKEQGINLIDGDHFCTENLVIEPLAGKLRIEFPKAIVSISEKHSQTAKFYM